MAIGEITMLIKATSNSKSLRTTIPMGIVRQFNLSKGGKLNWEIKAGNNELIIIVKPLRERKGDNP
ncbi:MAG: AbrB/MazE/SpoVT family DNA-binding domain-containing protein [Thermoprotei archaeon]